MDIFASLLIGKDGGGGGGGGYYQREERRIYSPWAIYTKSVGLPDMSDKNLFGKSSKNFKYNYILIICLTAVR